MASGADVRGWGRHDARAVRGLAAALVVLLGMGLLVLATRSPQHDTVHLSTGEPSPPSSTSEPPTSSTTTTAPAVVAPAPTTSAPAAPSPPATVRRTAPTTIGGSSTFGPNPPGTVSFPYEPGRSSWAGSSNGIAVSASVDQPTAPTGSPITFHISVSSGQPCCSLTVLFGDGSKFEKDTSYACPSGGPQTAGTMTVDAPHPYNRTGRWQFSVQAATGNCSTPHTYGELLGWVTATPGTTTSQGPAEPTITVAWANRPAGHESDQTYVTVAARASDQDGYVAGFSVDWGDGRPAERYPGDPMGCRPSSSGWPASSLAYLPTNPPPTHQYATGGRYAIKITATSTGCDGGDPQTATGNETWDTSGPNP